ncbi:MAG: hypothetical protein JWO06_2235 [Bacteroidota bacterium]|nr:hypothetical protein [Bacteroidota bacterium]
MYHVALIIFPILLVTGRIGLLLLIKALQLFHLLSMGIVLLLIAVIYESSSKKGRISKAKRPIKKYASYR